MSTENATKGAVDVRNDQHLIDAHLQDRLERDARALKRTFLLHWLAHRS